MTTTLSKPALKNTVRAYPGCRITFSLTAKETNGALSVLEMEMTPGSEPPRHKHIWEDETLMIKTGKIIFFVGDDLVYAKPGDTVFIPKGTPHHFVITSEKASCTLIITPGGLEKFFEEATQPYNLTTVPAVQRPLTDQEMKAMNVNAEKFGIRFV